MFFLWQHSAFYVFDEKYSEEHFDEMHQIYIGLLINNPAIYFQSFGQFAYSKIHLYVSYKSLVNIKIGMHLKYQDI